MRDHAEGDMLRALTCRPWCVYIMEVTPSKRKPSNLYSSTHQRRLLSRKRIVCARRRAPAVSPTARRATLQRSAVGRLGRQWDSPWRRRALAHLPLAVVEEARVPHPVVAALSRVEQVRVRAVKHVHTIQDVVGRVRVHHIHQHHETVRVRRVDQVLELVRRAAPRRHLVAKTIRPAHHKVALTASACTAHPPSDPSTVRTLGPCSTVLASCVVWVVARPCRGERRVNRERTIELRFR